MTVDSSIPSNLDDYSATSTIVLFDRPIPLLRGPVSAGRPDDPSLGPYVLAFRNPQSWAAAYAATESKIVEQCEGGARVGCALTASNNCKPPWWRNLVGGGPSAADLKEREECEQREMQECLAAAKEKCADFAREKCRIPFREARIAVGLPERARAEMGKKLVGIGSAPERRWRRSEWVGMVRMELEECGLCAAGSCKASELLGSDPNYRCFFEQS
ncbi:unnamed protein product [Linum tenue]|uniref:Uncharacterized protein n=1 Tax=Linum tenue TaxID=586396 RepID=A0AAV0LIP7_9ROSI|nr:unnamed protein product [Linum tenue]